jgi:hypothetical protein
VDSVRGSGHEGWSLCRQMWRNDHTQMKSSGRRRVRPHAATVTPRLDCALMTGLGWGHRMGMQHVFHRLCQKFLRRHQSKR